MTYELAKELKDAGFPSSRLATQPVLNEGGQERVYGQAHFWFVPTLPELIEACGDRFLFLDRRKDHPSYIPVGWRAQEVGTDNGIAEGNGATPEEAVARLWLAINKKA